jgi:hypothetical protein
MHLAVKLQEETLQNEKSHNWYKNQTLHTHSSEDEDISVQSDSDTGHTPDTNPHSGLTLQVSEKDYTLFFTFFFLGAQCVESGVSCTDCY